MLQKVAFFQKRCQSTKTLKDLPTLSSYPLIGHSYLFFPRGKYSTEKLTEAIVDLSKNLGGIFKLKLGGTEIVFSTNAEDAKTVFRNEGKYPIRPTFPALLHYRRRNFNSVGIVPGNGEEWYKFRQGVVSLLKTNVYKCYINEQRNISKDFVAYIKNVRNSENVVEDLFHHLLKFAIESISIISPGHRFHCFQKENSSKIIKASVDFMDGLYATLIGLPIWKFYKNKGYKQLESAHETIYKIIITYLNNQKQIFDENPDKLLQINPFLYYLFSNKALKWEDKEMLALEIFLAGIDATATTLTMTLYYLSCNKLIQRRARDESLDLNNEPIYLKACIKETLRLSPTAGATSRFLVNNCVLSGFQIPKGTLISVFNSITSNDERYFSNALEYKPERWLRTSSENINPFASLPFGHGPRMCPGRRLAFQEMEILLQEILRTFILEPIDASAVGMVFRMNRIPERQIDLKFVNTNC